MRRSQATRERTGAAALALLSPVDVLHEMRLKKEAPEIERMRRAVDVSRVAHYEAALAAHPGIFEYEIEARIDFAFRRQGAAGPAYPSIVASGANATILHYVENARRLEPGDLLLVDAGAEYDHYCADVTRTHPVGDAFTAEQRAVYEVVLEAQKAAISAVKPGTTFDEVHERALRVLVEGLRSLGVVTASADEAIQTHAYRSFYMHRTSHWLGMDVHDVGKYRSGDRSRALEPGMVLTVEPGLYFGEHVPPSPYTGIGVRIEDDVLVTEAGADVLSRDIPKEIDDLEAITRERARN